MKSTLAGANPERSLGPVLLIAGAVGTIAAFALMVERIRLLENPFYVPSCSLSKVLACTAVMQSEQASAFGFPNPLLGLVGFSLVTATGLSVLAGARLANWYWVALCGGLGAAVVFVHWLIFQTLYRIGALCPYCMAVWAAAILGFWYVALQVMRLFSAPDPPRVLAQLQRNHLVVPTVWLFMIAALAYERFWAPWRVS
jgi:uncharacterized membrane protein